MAGARKLLILGACCSIVLCSVSVFASGSKSSKPIASIVSNPPRTKSATFNAHIQDRAVQQTTGHQDLRAAASSTPNQFDSFLQQQQQQYLPSQPSIYHSIIDRTAASNHQLASPVQASTATTGDLNAAAGHHHGHHAHGKYYEYRAVPKKKTWKFGYKRGNHKHTIMRHEHGKAGKHPHFKTKVKWHDKKSKGKGIHLWDYNHHDKKHYHHG